MSLGMYRGPEIAAEHLAKWVQDQNAIILDVGAGTGQVTEELVKRGYKNVDALDPCEEMLDTAKTKNIYRKLHCAAITVSDKTEIEDDTYDGIVIAGAFGEGHIPCEGLKELIRITKPGGYIINAMRKEYMNTATDYKGRLKPFMEQLEEAGYWDCVAEETIDAFVYGKYDGVVFVGQVKAEGFPNYENVVLGDGISKICTENGHL